MEELTPEQIDDMARSKNQAIFCAQYLGAEFEYTGAEVYEPRQLTLYAVNKDGALMSDDSEDNEEFNMWDCFLFLKSLYDITDDDLKNIVTLQNLDYQVKPEDVTEVEMDKDTGEIFYKFAGGCGILQFDDLPKPCTDYLIRKFYLLPYLYENPDGSFKLLQPADIEKLNWADTTKTV